MESTSLTAEYILCQVRQIQTNKVKNLQVFKLLEYVEKNDSQNKAQQDRTVNEILQLLISSSANTHTNPAANNGIVYGCVIWLTYLQEQQKLTQLNEHQFESLHQWLLDQHETNEDNEDTICRILITLGRLFLLHPANGDKYFVKTFNILLKNISCDTGVDVLKIALQCIENILSTCNEVTLSDEQSELCAATGRRLLQIYFGDSKISMSNFSVLALVLCSLQILHKIVTLNSNFCRIYVSELLGLAKVYIHFGLEGSKTALLKPQKVFISQQALYDSTEQIETAINLENVRNSGGKIPKTRKPRIVNNTRPSDKKQAINRSPEIKVLGFTLLDIKVSDSDASDPENSTNRILFERSRKAKIRLTSINLIGAISRVLERKILYGYWHALFPNGIADSKDNLLYIGQFDPNLRCRSAALQVSAHLIYGSKGFLHQAEIDVKRCPTTFIPFSVSLGFTVLAIYKSLTTILSSESSLPVVIQALKCLAVLVQASPFEQFKKGFVQSFVKDVKPLVYHRDAAIQVSALMVMEFLIALPETTCDIAEAVGLPLEAAIKKIPKIHHEGDEQIEIVNIEEFVESEDERCNDYVRNNSPKIGDCGTSDTTDSSWLLLRVLHNLTKHDKGIASSVRIESLQVLIVLSSHFALIKPHLTRISEVLQYSLNDLLPDVRLYAARCVDSCAYQINHYLLNKVTLCPEEEIRECNKFWLNMMPIILGHIQRESEEATTIRTALCDALSNIGVVIFEYTPHSNQISLLSFLSGISSECTEDAIVRAATVRALAVFALYPSLRGDLVFIENTAELTLRLATDSSLLVRIKIFWSLGIISDALIGKGADISQHSLESLSDDLLYRLITAAITACVDNDKVRCNAVRILGNLLRLLTENHLRSRHQLNWRQIFEKAVAKLTDCIRSSGNAKVKWNTCYAISNLMLNRAVFNVCDLNWQEMLYTALCHVIVHHANFKVRINASTAIMNITDRSHFGIYYEKFWSSLLEAIEQSHNLDNFHEYNHRDNLQEQLCLALSHIVELSTNDDLTMLKRHFLPYVETIRKTWKRVINRMVPERAARLLSCPVALFERGKPKNSLSLEQKKIIDFLIEILKPE